MDDTSASAGVTLDTVIRDVIEASKVPAKRRQAGIRSRVEELTSLAYERGVLPEDLTELVDLITTPSHLDQASLAAIVKNLYPVEKVSEEALLKVVGCLGHGQLKPSLTIQALLLRWIILVYHSIGNQNVLSQAYSVLFNLIDTAAVRPQLCHLLALITRRKHVRPYRIKAVITLCSQTGNDLSLRGLLRVYKNYYPEITVEGKASAFKHPDPQWRIRLDEIQAVHRQRRELDSQGPQNGFQVKHRYINRIKGSKGAAIPVVYTSRAHENSVTLEEIDNVDSFVQNIEKIELPNQLVAVLVDPLLQKLMVLRQDHEASRRASNWIMACISDLATGDGDRAMLLDTLEIIRDYAAVAKTLAHFFLDFIRDILRNSPDSYDARDVIMECLPYTPLAEWSELYSSTFQPLEAVALDNTPESQLSLLEFYTSLLRRWTNILMALDEAPAHSASTISSLIEHVNKLCLTVLQTSPTASTHLTIVDFYETAACMLTDQTFLERVQITIPSPYLVYILQFSQSLAVVSRICGVLALYKQGLEKARTKSAEQQLPPYETKHINTFNGFLVDICNCFWRGRAFSDTDTNAQGCLVPQSVIPSLAKYLTSLDKDLALVAAFTLSLSPLLSLQSISYVRELEDAELETGSGELRARHAGPVTQSSLAQLRLRGGLAMTWQEYRSGVLKYLSGKGMDGIPEFMYNTMKNLRETRAAA
ncbi:Centromere protein I [Pleurostoma richardsiae]|uniref:Centromere protein I n=1 Tax=Pleurostoma richardsiae TaxID=41990 RepID=A0AA38RD25_9PEZI|nr:Centromere protein I [Pleurostoma richardsiae]